MLRNVGPKWFALIAALSAPLLGEVVILAGVSNGAPPTDAIFWMALVAYYPMALALVGVPAAVIGGLAAAGVRLLPQQVAVSAWILVLACLGIGAVAGWALAYAVTVDRAAGLLAGAFLGLACPLLVGVSPPNNRLERTAS